MMRRRCQACPGTVDLEPCSGCGLAYYCARSKSSSRSGEERRLHGGGQGEQGKTAEHDVACKALAQARGLVALEEAKLRESSANSVGGLFSAPPRVFEDHAGYFWDIAETREYLRARLAYTEALLALGTLDAAELVVSEYDDMLRLSQWDMLDIRHRLLGQLARLGRGERCYELVKIWLLEDMIGDEGSNNVLQVAARPARSNSISSSDGATSATTTDLFEDPSTVLGPAEPYFELLKLVPVLVIKIGLWLNLREMHQAYGLRSTLPPEMVCTVQMELAGPAVRANDAVMSAVRSGKSLLPHEREMRLQAASIARAVTKAQGGREFWDLMSLTSDPYEKIDESLESGYCTVQPAHAAFRYNHVSFLEMPLGVWAVESMLRDDGVADMPDYDTPDHAWDGSDEDMGSGK
ncbi:MYND finger [Geosmithia morbida]|uniref:MYND finger n=1 Tax=Geosmithia morbida TaxID=1094350 RepID=A0A9P4YXR0_9HYPO|nr:MYND finger [Geosmithia morbida]KAF4124437.1 MYND finger [Geosmithia morbida]